MTSMQQWFGYGLIFVSSWFYGGSTDAAREWLYRYEQLFNQPFSADFEILPGGPLAQEKNLGGHIIYGSNQRLKYDLNMFYMEDEGSELVKFRTIICSDGTDIWLEIHLGEEEPLVMTASLENIAKLPKENPMADILDDDPTATVRALANGLNFGINRIEDGKVFLYAKAKRKELLALMSNKEGLSRKFRNFGVEIILDEQNIAPVTLTIGAKQGRILTVTLKNYKPLSPAEEQSSFVYQPPEGVEIIDMNDLTDNEVQ